MFIGNRAINALHGGATGAFLEMTAISQLYLQSDLQRLPKTINLTIDYLRSAKGGEDLYAHAIVHKLGRRMASVRAEAWQGDKDKPVTALQALIEGDRDRVEADRQQAKRRAGGKGCRVSA